MMQAEKTFIIGLDQIPEYIVLGAGESAKFTFIALPGRDSALAFSADLVAPGASLDIAGLYVCEGDEKVGFNINVRHLCGGCHSSQLFKGVADGHSRVDFDGLIYVAPDAQKTEAYQSSHNLLLSRDARVESCPQLEIYADDVICSHGATIGSLDEEGQFYMRSRGIPEAEARRLQIVSFLSEVISRLPEDAVRALREAAPQVFVD